MKHIKRAEYIFHIKSILMLGLPIIIGQLGNIITGLADTVMVGQHSTDELAAASFVNNVINAFIILGTGFSFSYTPMFVSYFLVAIPSGYCIAFLLGKGISGVWLSYPIGFTCAVLLLGFRAFRVMNRKGTERAMRVEKRSAKDCR